MKCSTCYRHLHACMHSCVHMYSYPLVLLPRKQGQYHFNTSLGVLSNKETEKKWKGRRKVRSNLSAGISHLSIHRCFLISPAYVAGTSRNGGSCDVMLFFLSHTPSFKYRWKLLSCVRNVTDNIKGSLQHFPFLFCQLLLPPAYSLSLKTPFFVMWRKLWCK